MEKEAVVYSVKELFNCKLFNWQVIVLWEVALMVMAGGSDAVITGLGRIENQRIAGSPVIFYQVCVD